MQRKKLILAAGVCAAAVACSSDTGDDDEQLDSSGGGGAGTSSVVFGGSSSIGGTGAASRVGSGGSGLGGTTGGAGDSTALGGSGGGLTVPGRDVCHGMPYEGSAGMGEACVGHNAGVEPLPVDLYMIMDRTSSMNELLGDSGLSRWETITAAMQRFVALEDVQNTRVGMQFFSLTATLDEAVECDPASYANPAVQIGPISETGPALTTAIEEMTQLVGGLTPTYAALQGAVQHATDYADSTGRTAAVVLVTDGLPTQCEVRSVAAITDLAARARVEAEVLTFVIGLSPGIWNLHQIAQQGGTSEAYIIDQGDGVEQFVDTIRSISATPFPCEFEIPEVDNPTLDIDYEKVQVLYWPENQGAPEEIPKISDSSVCSRSPHGGWYYDSGVNPTSIRVCECICNRFGRGIAEVRFGCKPHIFDIQ